MLQCKCNVMASGDPVENLLEKNMLLNSSISADKKIDATGSCPEQDDDDCSLNFEKSFDDLISNSDSLSSSASLSESDISSTDSEDSLALSESESITDVTPLNSPYCDSPLPQSRVLEHKSEDKTLTPKRNPDRTGKKEGCCPPEMNVLMQAIEKLEIEAKKAEQPVVRDTESQRRRTASCGVEDVKRVEQENLFKRVISQQGRIRNVYATESRHCRKGVNNNRRHDLAKSDGDVSVLPKNAHLSKSLKHGSKYSHRQHKCLSHPSSMFSHRSLASKILLDDDACHGNVDHNTSDSAAGSSSSMLPVTSDAEELFYFEK